MSREPKPGGEAPMELEALRARVIELERATGELERRLEARKESQARFEAAVRGASDGLWDRSLVTGDLWWSPRFRELIGYSKEELPASYESFQALMHPDDRDRSLQARRLHLEEGRPYQIEYRLRTKTDGYRWFLARGAAVRDEAGRPVRMAGTIQDIDDRKRAEASRARLVSILEATTDFVGIIDRSRETVYVNRAGRTMVGLGEDEDVLAAEIVGCHPAWALKIVLEEGLPAAVRDGFWVGETALLSADGGEIPVSQLILAHKDEGGEVDYLSTVARDISALKQAEEALRESEQRYRSFVQNSPGIAFRGRMDYTPVFFHGAVEEITGYAEAEFIEANPSWDQVIHKEDFRSLRENFDAMATIPGFVTQREYRIVRKDGQIRWVQENSRNACDASGTPRYVDGTLIDITERKRIEGERRLLERQLRQAQKMEAVGQLAAGVAHDFNNILTVILGNAELLLPMLQGVFDDRAGEMTRNGIEEIKMAGQRAAAITRQLLAVGHKETITADVLELDRVIRDTGEMLRRLLRDDIVFDVNVAPDTHCVRADAGQIEQVVMNLVLNARDAMPGGGALSMTCANADLDEAHANAHAGARPGPHVILTVSDTGIGMTKETTEHIFEPFFTTKQMGEGSGLGLATVYGILRQMGGHISVESELERGSTFRVYLPAVEEERAEREPAVAMDGSGGDEVILVCEDEEAVRQLVCRVLRAAGYTVLEAEDGRAALAVAEGHRGPIHLLVSDVVMPEMDGRRLFQELARSRPGMRVMFVSGYTDDVIDGELSRAEGWGFLQKPFSTSALQSRVREMLDQG